MRFIARKETNRKQKIMEKCKYKINSLIGRLKHNQILNEKIKYLSMLDEEFTPYCKLWEWNTARNVENIYALTEEGAGIVIQERGGRGRGWYRAL